MSSTNEELEKLRERIKFQDDYSDIEVNPTLGEEFSKEWNAILLASSASNLDIVDGKEESVSLSANFLNASTIYPIQVKKIESSTGINSSDIALLRR